MRFDDVLFSNNTGSTLYHRYSADLVAMTITMNDCQWSGNRGHLTSAKAHSVATSLIEMASRNLSAADCQKQGNAQGGAHLVLEKNNNFTANVFYPDSLMNAYCGMISIARSTFSGNNESILSVEQSEVEIAQLRAQLGQRVELAGVQLEHQHTVNTAEHHVLRQASALAKVEFRSAVAEEQGRFEQRQAIARNEVLNEVGKEGDYYCESNHVNEHD